MISRAIRIDHLPDRSVHPMRISTIDTTAAALRGMPHPMWLVDGRSTPIDTASAKMATFRSEIETALTLTTSKATSISGKEA